MATRIGDKSALQIMRNTNRFHRSMISMFVLVLTSYVMTFYAMRFAVRVAGYPRIYMFSSDPVRNQWAHRFFTPMIVMTGGVSGLPAVVGDLKDATTMKDNRPVYVIGTEPLFGRLAAHYEVFQRLPQ